MAKQEKMDRHLRCSFCGKSRDEVRKLIAWAASSAATRAVAVEVRPSRWMRPAVRGIESERRWRGGTRAP